MKARLLFWAVLAFLLLHFALAENYFLQEADTENINDARIIEATPDTNDNGANLGVRGNSTIAAKRSFIMFNLSNFTSANLINEAYFRWKVTIDEGVGAPQAFEVNTTWDETTITWNNQMDSTDWDDTKMNTTLESSSTSGTGNKVFNVTNMVSRAVREGRGNITIMIIVVNVDAGIEALADSKEGATPSNRPALNITFIPITGDTAPPEINQDSYNMISEGGAGCIEWRTDKNIGCTTGDTTPTVNFTTNENARCAIGTSDLNYTGLGANRECSGAGTTTHTCTLIPQDELTGEDYFIYIGCKDTVLEANENSTSTSGALRISIQSSDLESIGRTAIETGAQHALGSGYTIYTEQKLYARDSGNNQFTAAFDKIIKWLNKIWAFNFLTGNETPASDSFNISPGLYVLEMTNSTNSTINSTVYQLIMDTK